MTILVNYVFRGFPAIVRGKRDEFSGVVKIAPVGPDYDRSKESWVIMDVQSYGSKNAELRVPDAQWSTLALWLKHNKIACDAIDAALRSKTGVRV